MMYKKTTTAIVPMAVFLFLSHWTYAQVAVEDRKVPSAAVKSQSAPPAANIAAELHYQLQVLQQEVLQLRGMVEQQSNEIKKLKQQRLDDYLDLDRRLSQLGNSTSSSSAATTNTSNGSLATSSLINSNISPEEELSSYKSAINLVLREQKYDEAIAGLSKHLDDYPRGRYSANAQYWLGEIYMLKNELDSAQQWFTRLLRDFPEHTKVPDAQFKLGKVYYLLGDKAAAKTLLEKVAQSDNNAARLARDYLDANY